MDGINESGKELAIAILQTLQQAISTQIKCDKTFRGKVISQVSDKKYKVLYKNTEYTAKSDHVVEIGQMVNVCAPQNDWSNLYIQA